MLDDLGCSWAYEYNPITKRREVKLNMARVSFELVPIKPSSTGVRIRVMPYKCRVSNKNALLGNRRLEHSTNVESAFSRLSHQARGVEKLS